MSVPLCSFFFFYAATGKQLSMQCVNKSEANHQVKAAAKSSPLKPLYIYCIGSIKSERN